jgi:hypothetical protein
MRVWMRRWRRRWAGSWLFRYLGVEEMLGDGEFWGGLIIDEPCIKT